MGRSPALWLLGLWLGMLLASWAAATINFRTADRLAGAPLADAPDRPAAVAAEDRRALLRHVAAEINRWIFRWWSAAQVVLGAAVVVAAWRSPAALRVTIAAAVLIALAQAILLGPAIGALGRGLDFAPRPLPPDVARRFGLLHGAYMAADVFKALLLLAASWVLAKRG